MMCGRRHIDKKAHRLHGLCSGLSSLCSVSFFHFFIYISHSSFLISHLRSSFLISHLRSSFLISLLFLASCEYKDLCYDHNHWTDVRVYFDWRNAPQAEPQGMTVLFYNQEAPAAEPVRYDLTGRDGGTARLTPGTWRAACYNYDTETILYRGMDHISTLEAYTRQSTIEEGTQLSRSGMPRARNTENEPVILEPDPLWGSVNDPFSLDLSEPTSDAARTSRTGDDSPQPSAAVTLYPDYRVCDVTITIHDVPNLQYSSQFGGALSGLSPGVMMATGQLVDGSVSQAFTCSAVDATTLQMHFRIFGHCPHRSEGIVNSHLLTVYSILADGSQWYYTQDVGNQMHDTTQNPDDYHLYINLDGLPVPKPIVNGSGFRPTIDGWQGEEIEVTM